MSSMNVLFPRIFSGNFFRNRLLGGAQSFFGELANDLSISMLSLYVFIHVTKA